MNERNTGRVMRRSREVAGVKILSVRTRVVLRSWALSCQSRIDRFR